MNFICLVTLAAKFLQIDRMNRKNIRLSNSTVYTLKFNSKYKKSDKNDGW